MELKAKYKNTKFLVVDEGYFLKIIYNNEDLLTDENFIDFVYDLANENLSPEDNSRLAVVFDYLNEID